MCTNTIIRMQNYYWRKIVMRQVYCQIRSLILKKHFLNCFPLNISCNIHLIFGLSLFSQVTWIIQLFISNFKVAIFTKKFQFLESRWYCKYSGQFNSPVYFAVTWCCSSGNIWTDCLGYYAFAIKTLRTQSNLCFKSFKGPNFLKEHIKRTVILCHIDFVFGNK